MFYNCNNLGVDGTDEEGGVITGNLSITDSIFNSSNSIHNMSYMFYKCYGLTGMPSIDTRAAENMSNMFFYCNNTAFSEVTDFHIDSATNITSLFEGCTNLTKVEFTGTKNGGTVSASSLTTGNTNKVFNSCNKIGMITFQDHEFSTLGSFYNFLTGAKGSLKQISFNEIDAPGLTTFASMFDGFAKLRSVDLSGLKAENVTSAEKMFNGCTNLGVTGDGVEGSIVFEGSIILGEGFILTEKEKKVIRTDEPHWRQPEIEVPEGRFPAVPRERNRCRTASPSDSPTGRRLGDRSRPTAGRTAAARPFPGS